MAFMHMMKGDMPGTIHAINICARVVIRFPGICRFRYRGITGQRRAMILLYPLTVLGVSLIYQSYVLRFGCPKLSLKVLILVSHVYRVAAIVAQTVASFLVKSLPLYPFSSLTLRHYRN